MGLQFLKSKTHLKWSIILHGMAAVGNSPISTRKIRGERHWSISGRCSSFLSHVCSGGSAFLYRSGVREEGLYFIYFVKGGFSSLLPFFHGNNLSPAKQLPRELCQNVSSRLSRAQSRGDRTGGQWGIQAWMLGTSGLTPASTCELFDLCQTGSYSLVSVFSSIH